MTTTRTHFATEKAAWHFATMIGAISKGWIVLDFGVDSENVGEPFYVDTVNDTFATKDELMKRFGMMA